MNYDIYLGYPTTNNAQATSICVAEKIPAGTLIKADGSAPAEGQTIYGVAGQTAVPTPDGKYRQTVWTAGNIFACMPTTNIPNAHVVETLDHAVRLDANGQKETVSDAVILKI